MQKPECILIRVGEMSLKSEQVRKKWNRILIGNISNALKENKIKFKISSNPNRIFIHTKQVEKSIKILKRVFGIHSLSPVWICKSEINEMSKLAVKLAKKILNKKTSFAIIARRSGVHNFTSQDIGREVGSAVNEVTGAPVNLTNPDRWIEIECRSGTTYMFIERIRGVGGLPIGVSGKIAAILYRKSDVLAAILLAKRGCEILSISNKNSLIKELKKWYLGRKLDTAKGSPSEVMKKENIFSVVFDDREKLVKKLSKEGFLVFNPLITFSKKEKINLLSTMGKL